LYEWTAKTLQASQMPFRVNFLNRSVVRSYGEKGEITKNRPILTIRRGFWRFFNNSAHFLTLSCTFFGHRVQEKKEVLLGTKDLRRRLTLINAVLVGLVYLAGAYFDASINKLTPFPHRGAG